MILPKDRDPRFITVRRGGTLTDADHHLLALWAADCAEHVLHLFENVRPTDDRPRQAIEQARAWARGDITWTKAREAAFAANAGCAGHAASRAGLGTAAWGALLTSGAGPACACTGLRTRAGTHRRITADLCLTAHSAGPDCARTGAPSFRRRAEPACARYACAAARGRRAALTSASLACRAAAVSAGARVVGRGIGTSGTAAGWR